MDEIINGMADEAQVDETDNGTDAGSDVANQGVDENKDANERGHEDEPGKAAPMEAGTAKDGDGSGYNSKGKQDGGAGDEGQKPKAAQSREKNAEFARQRREKEEQARTRQAVAEAVIDALGGKNPYTGKPMKDARDVDVYRRMKAIKDKGGDPVTDYADAMEEQARQNEKKQEEEARSSKWFEDDRAAFASKYPDVDLKALIEDEDFSDYAEGKVGKKPLADIYEGYRKLMGKAKDAGKDAAQERAAQALANKRASPGAQGAGKPAPALTREKILRMSYEERAALFEKNPDAYRAAMRG